MSKKKSTQISKEQLEEWPKLIKVELLLPREMYASIFEIAINRKPQISVVEVIREWLQKKLREEN